LFIKKRGTNSIINEVVHSLCEDKKGNIWGSTDNGVFCYQQSDERFTNIILKAMTPGVIFLIFVAISKDQS
jgi:ligand-binding sensor domain-containing protein